MDIELSLATNRDHALLPYVADHQVACHDRALWDTAALAQRLGF